MKYILKNIKLFIKNEKMIFMLIVICVITSSFIIIFSYGLYQNYRMVEADEESKVNNIYIEILDSDSVTKEKLKRCVFSVSYKTNKHITMYGVYPVLEDFDNQYKTNAVNRFTIENKKIKRSELFERNIKQNGEIITGYYFTDEQEKNGDLVALLNVPDEYRENNTVYKNISELERKSRIKIQGKEYEIIGYHTASYAPLFPFESLDEDTVFQDEIFIYFDRPVKTSQYNELRNNFEKTFGSAIKFPDMYFIEKENTYFYNTIMIISVLIAFLSAVNFSALYRFILSKRIKMLAVFRICGCTKGRAMIFFLAECMIITVPLFILTAIIYNELVIPVFDNYFEFISEVYSADIYMRISGIYIVTSLIVLFVMIKEFLKKSIREEKEGK